MINNNYPIVSIGQFYWYLSVGSLAFVNGNNAHYQVYFISHLSLITLMQRQNFSLACLHRECELNYSRLMRLSDEDICLGSRFHIKNGAKSRIDFRVIDRAKFTTTLFVRVESTSPKWLPSIELKARIYRDAKMAEVIEWCSDSTIPWVLVERKGPQSKDEKWQWNIFLGELLYQAIRHQRIAQAQSL